MYVFSGVVVVFSSLIFSWYPYTEAAPSTPTLIYSRVPVTDEQTPAPDVFDWFVNQVESAVDGIDMSLCKRMAVGGHYMFDRFIYCLYFFYYSFVVFIFFSSGLSCSCICSWRFYFFVICF